MDELDRKFAEIFGDKFCECGRALTFNNGKPPCPLCVNIQAIIGPPVGGHQIKLEENDG